MFKSKRKRQSINQIISYTSPVLHQGKTWYVDFKIYDPLQESMRRKKYMLDRYKKNSDKKRYANELILLLSQKLKSGWNPFVDASSARQYTPYIDVISLYHKNLEKLLKIKSIKESTYKDYKKRIKVLTDYNSKHYPPVQYIYQFDQTYILDFLDYILIDRDSSARTRNNYKIWLSSFCSWLIEKQYMQTNPCENIKSLKEDVKKRTALSTTDLAKLNRYLKKKNPYFLLLCQFAYYTFIRPEEITNLKLKDINIKEQKVFISKEISKNRKDAMVGLNDSLIKSFLDLGYFNYSGDSYIFGKGFKPSKTKNTTRVFRDHFNKARAALKFPDTYQFYSLKDTGIRDLANAEGIVIARDQARHADISTTNKYLSGSSLTVHEETKHFNGTF